MSWLLTSRFAANASSLLLSRTSRVRPVMAFTFSSTDALTVEHHEKDHEFVVQMGQDRAVLNYEFIGKNKVELFHTEVPAVFRGRGVAKLLAKSAFDFVAEQPNLKMKVTCTYLQKFLKETDAKDKERYLKHLTAE